jgi:hypothetical protein
MTGLVQPFRPLIQTEGLHPVDTGTAIALLDGLVDPLAYPSLSAALAANPGRAFPLINTTHAVDADLTDATAVLLLRQGAILSVPVSRTINAQLDFSAGGMLVPAAGVTVTLARVPVGWKGQIFDLSLGGTVHFDSADTKIDIRWFGAIEGGDVTTELQAAINSVTAEPVLLQNTPTILIPFACSLSDTIVATRRNFNLIGVGWGVDSGTIITWTGIAGGTMFQLVASGPTKVRNILFAGDPDGVLAPDVFDLRSSDTLGPTDYVEFYNCAFGFDGNFAVGTIQVNRPVFTSNTGPSNGTGFRTHFRLCQMVRCNWGWYNAKLQELAGRMVGCTIAACPVAIATASTIDLFEHYHIHNDLEFDLILDAGLPSSGPARVWAQQIQIESMKKLVRCLQTWGQLDLVSGSIQNANVADDPLLMVEVDNAASPFGLRLGNPDAPGDFAWSDFRTGANARLPVEIQIYLPTSANQPNEKTFEFHGFATPSLEATLRFNFRKTGSPLNTQTNLLVNWDRPGFSTRPMLKVRSALNFSMVYRDEQRIALSDLVSSQRQEPVDTFITGTGSSSRGGNIAIVTETTEVTLAGASPYTVPRITPAGAITLLVSARRNPAAFETYTVSLGPVANPTLWCDNWQVGPSAAHQTNGGSLSATWAPLATGGQRGDIVITSPDNLDGVIVELTTHALYFNQSPLLSLTGAIQEALWGAWDFSQVTDLVGASFTDLLNPAVGGSRVFPINVASTPVVSTLGSAKCLLFDGINDDVTIGNDVPKSFYRFMHGAPGHAILGHNVGCTIFAVVYRLANTGIQLIVGDGLGAAGSTSFSILTTAGSDVIKLFIDNGSGTHVVNAAACGTLAVNTLACIWVRFNGTSYDTGIDATPGASGAFVGAPNNVDSVSTLQIGSLFNGKIGGVWSSNREMTQAEAIAQAAIYKTIFV